MNQPVNQTNTSNEYYDVISVLYHSLQGAQTYAKYVEDAGRRGDQELVQFFTQVQQDEVVRVERAKQLLARRLTQQPVAR